MRPPSPLVSGVRPGRRPLRGSRFSRWRLRHFPRRHGQALIRTSRPSTCSRSCWRPMAISTPAPPARVSSIASSPMARPTWPPRPPAPPSPRSRKTAPGNVYYASSPTGDVQCLPASGLPGIYAHTDQTTVYGLAARPDGSLLAATGPNGVLLRIPRANEVEVLERPETGLVSALAVSGDTLYLGRTCAHRPAPARALRRLFRATGIRRPRRRPGRPLGPRPRHCRHARGGSRESRNPFRRFRESR